jgi:RNA polymerase sigma factor (sigma-70 family)
MREALSIPWMVEQPNQRITRVMEEEGSRLRGFIRNRVADPALVEDILQDAFYELVLADRLAIQIEHVSAWLFRVVRNRITDGFRRKKAEVSTDEPIGSLEDEPFTLKDLLPSPEAGPEAAFANRVLVQELEEALAELPREQREVFLANEIEGRSFRELAEESGVSINTLLSRKRYAVRHLRERLQAIYEDFSER